MRDIEHYRQLLARPRWHTSGELLSSAQAEWLLHSASLTEKLQTICPCLRVEIVDEGWQAVEYDGKLTKQWQRDVLLKCGDSNWIFAQTSLPQETVEQVAQAVLSLGNQPIGLWLFPQQPQRQSLSWQCTDQGLYARRSQLLLKGYPIEIKELFLNDFPFGKHHDTNYPAL